MVHAATVSARGRGMTQDERFVVMASSTGTVFEWYDFYLYATLAPFFASLFFPPGNDTAALLSAVSEPDPRIRTRRIILEGEVANPASPPEGCYFHPRCPHAIEMCRTHVPPWQEISPAHFVACHRARELQLAGVE